MRRLLPVVALALACGNPSNVVYGGISATSNTPPVAISEVRSAISGVATLSDANGKAIRQSSVMILSDKANLCDALAAKPDYFRNPPEQFTGVALFTKVDSLGTFRPALTADLSGSNVYATLGAPNPQVAFGAVDGYINLNQFDYGAGGHAYGSFQLVYDVQGGLVELDGRFKTDVCPAIAGAQLP